MSDKKWFFGPVKFSHSVLLGTCLAMLFSGAHAFSVYELDPASTVPQLASPRIGKETPAWSELCDVAPNWQALTRREAAYFALCRNPKLQGTLATLKTQAARHGQTLALNLPTLNFSATSSRRTTGSFLIDNRPELQVRGDNEKLQKSGFSASVPLFSSGAMMSASNASQKAVQAAVLDVAELVDSLLVDVLVAYYEFYLAQELLNVFEEARLIAAQSAEIAIMREKGGVGSRSEVFQAQSALARAEIELRRARDDKHIKRATLAQIFAIDPSTMTLGRIKRFKLGMLDMKLPAVLPTPELLALSRPLYASTLARHESALAKTQQAEREGLANVSMNAGLAKQSQFNRDIPSQSGIEKNLGITLSVPLFEGFGRVYKVREAASVAENIRQEMSAIYARLVGEIQQNRHTLLQEQDNQSYVEQYVQTTKEAHKAALQRYRKGLTEITEVLNAQREVTSAEAEYLRSSVRRLTAWLKVNRDLGKIADDFDDGSTTP